MRLACTVATLTAVTALLASAQTTSDAVSGMSPEEMQAVQQMQEALPECALQCLATLIPQSGCAMTDVDCICSNSQLDQTLAICLAGNCTVIETFATQKYQKNMCGAPIRDRHHEPIVTAWTLFAFALVCVIARFFARSNRLFNGPGYGWDDWFVLIDMPILLAGNTMTHIMCKRGLGKDVWELTPHQITDVFFLFWTNQFTYVGMLLFTKVSILLLYLRIFPSHIVSPWFRLSVLILIALMFAYGISMWFAIVFTCTPIDYAWHNWKGEGNGTCIDTLALIYSCAALNIVLDLLVFALPIPQVWQLQLNKRAKVGVCATFLVGLFATICSIVRLQYLVKWGNSPNPSWDYVDLTIWSLIEGNVVVICACMPPMSNLIRRFWHKSSSYFSRSKGTDYYSKSGHSAGHEMEMGQDPRAKKTIAKTETTTVAYDDRAPSERTDEVELVVKGHDPRWHPDEVPRRFL